MRRISFEMGLAVLVLVTHLYAVFVPANSLVMGWFSSDDAFYYFKTAQNITEGHGITFDGLGRDSGFHPLWMLVITPIFALARADRILPLRLVVLLSALLNAGTAVLLYRLAKRFLDPFAAALIALFWAFYPFINSRVTQMGMESGLSAFLIVLLVYRLSRAEDAQPDAQSPAALQTLRPALLTGIIAALTVFARLDNIFLVLVAGAWLAFRPWRVRYLLLADIALIALGVLWSYMKGVGFGVQYPQFSTSSYCMVIAALALRVSLYYFTGLYNRPAEGRKGLLIQLARAAGISLLASALLSGLMLALLRLHVFSGFPRRVLVYEAGFALAAVLATRLAAWLLSRESTGDEPMRWRNTILRLVGYFGPIGVTLLVYMGWSLVYFGTPMPVSGQIKRWWGTLPNPIYGQPVETTVGMLGFVKGTNGPWGLVRTLIAWPGTLPEWSRLLIYGGIALVILIWQWKRTKFSIHGLAWFPLAVGSFIQLISYTGTGYLHMRTWYWVSHMLAITLLLGIIVDNLLCWAKNAASWTKSRQRALYIPRLANILVIALGALVVLYGMKEMIRFMPVYVRPARAEFYLDSIHELERDTEPGSLIGSTGGGVIAYFVDDRTIVNLDGLMNTNEYFRLLQQGKASQYLDHIGLDYVYSGETVITDSDPYFQFKNKLEKLKSFGGATLFRWKR